MSKGYTISLDNFNIDLYEQLINQKLDFNLNIVNRFDQMRKDINFLFISGIINDREKSTLFLRVTKKLIIHIEDEN